MDLVIMYNITIYLVIIKLLISPEMLEKVNYCLRPVTH